MSATAAPKSAKPARRWRVTRRGFLIGAGALAGTVALGVTVGLPLLRRRVAESTVDSSPPGNPSKEPIAWFEILKDDRIRLYVTKSEMGQGVHTALAQLSAEELEISLADLDVAQATTDHPNQDASGTGGSGSMSSMYVPIRQAAATLREMMRAQAARQLNQPISNIEIKDRGLQARGDASLRLAFSALAADQRTWMANVPKEVPALKPRESFKVIGQSVPRIDIPAKVSGKAMYAYDLRVDGMLYGAIAHPPTLEAKLTGANSSAAQAIAGVHKVVLDVGAGVAGVVAKSRSAAWAGVGAMQPIWNEGRKWQQSEIDAIVTVGGADGITIQAVGDAPRALGGTAVIEAEYRSPLAIQTPLEAQAALADVKADRATVWASTQSPDLTRRRVAAAIGFKPEQVEVVTPLLGGGFGRKSDTEAPAEAARLSQAAGVPVHLSWTRTEELRNGYLRPPTHHRLRARLSDGGMIEAMEHQQASSNVLFQWFPKFVADLLGADFGAYRGATIRYNIPNRHTVTWRKALPVRTGSWRGLGALPNSFALESFMDELAHTAGEDPLAFRIKHLGDDAFGRRMRAVLEAAAEAAGWASPPPAGRARGIACASDVNTMVAEVAEVSLDATGALRVHQISAAMDCGLVINPDGARAQVEGNVMWGVGSSLLEEAKIVDGRVSAANFDGYPLLTLASAPVVKTVLVASDDEVRGVGEPAIAPVAAAIGNALFALTGKRLRQIPFTAERIAAA